MTATGKAQVETETGTETGTKTAVETVLEAEVAVEADADIGIEVEPGRPTPNHLLRFLFGALSALLFFEGATRLVVEPDSVLRWHDYGAQLKVGQLDAGGPFDTAVIGTSMAQQGLVPSVLEDATGQSTYNAALNGGVPAVMEPWLLDEVMPRAAPTRVLWGLSSIDFSATYGDATVSAYEQALATRSGALATIDQTLSRYSRFMASRSVLRNPSALFGHTAGENERNLQAASDELGDNGERLNFAERVSADRALEVQSRIAPYALDPDDLAAIVRTVDALRADGVEVVFVELPVPPRLIGLYPDRAETHARFQVTAQALADELGVRLVALDEAETYGDDDFVDFTHLDAEAAERFTRQVAAQL